MRLAAGVVVAKLRPLVPFAALAFVVNAVWEVAQMPLYDVDFRVLHCLRAAVADAALIVAVTLVATALDRRRAGTFWLILPPALTVSAAAIEVTSLATGRWAYAPAMPTVAGLGLTPLVQLPLLGSVAALATLRRPRPRVSAPA